MKTYILHWKTGETEKISGENIGNAMNHAGYGAGAVPVLDYYEEMKAQSNKSSSRPDKTGCICGPFYLNQGTHNSVCPRYR